MNLDASPQRKKSIEYYARKSVNLLDIAHQYVRYGNPLQKSSGAGDGRVERASIPIETNIPGTSESTERVTEQNKTTDQPGSARRLKSSAQNSFDRKQRRDKRHQHSFSIGKDDNVRVDVRSSLY